MYAVQPEFRFQTRFYVIRTTSNPRPGILENIGVQKVDYEKEEEHGAEAAPNPRPPDLDRIVLGRIGALQMIPGLFRGPHHGRCTDDLALGRKPVQIPARFLRSFLVPILWLAVRIVRFFRHGCSLACCGSIDQTSN